MSSTTLLTFEFHFRGSGLMGHGNGVTPGGGGGGGGANPPPPGGGGGAGGGGAVPVCGGLIIFDNPAIEKNKF